jgi:hypothetical protein
MKRHPDTQAPGAPSATDASRSPAGLVLGWYTIPGRRRVRALATAETGLCLVDEAPDGAVLVEPRLEGMAQARALAADYLALACERGEPQSHHPWPPDACSHERGQ